jgi:hypothetical protein
MARRLIEAGVRFVTVNMFETVFDEVTWDIHGSKPFTDIVQMSKEVAPNFDQAYTALLEDLGERGLLSTTMVVALGEFGRTPKVNPAGGRDHHPGVWTILMGGGPIRGGTVIGESDELGYAPKARPVTPGEVAATLYKGLGLDPHKELPGPQNRPIPLAEFSILPNLFCYIFCVAPLQEYSNILPNLLCDTFCAAPLWLVHAILGDVPNGTSSRGLGWESPQLPPGFTQGSGFQAFCDTVSASDPAARCRIPLCCGMSSGKIIQVTLLGEVACQRRKR